MRFLHDAAPEKYVLFAPKEKAVPEIAPPKEPEKAVIEKSIPEKVEPVAETIEQKRKATCERVMQKIKNIVNSFSEI